MVIVIEIISYWHHSRLILTVLLVQAPGSHYSVFCKGQFHIIYCLWKGIALLLLKSVDKYLYSGDYGLKFCVGSQSDEESCWQRDMDLQDCLWEELYFDILLFNVATPD